MRIQSSRVENEGLKKDAKDKAFIHTGAISLSKAHPVCSAYRHIFQHFCKCSSQFRYHRSSVQRRRDPTHVYFICAFFSLSSKWHPAGNGRRNRIKNIWHRVGVA